MKVLIIDGMNFLHRARAGFALGPNPLMFNFYRGLRAQVELHKPQRVFFVLEGHPKHRHAALPEYKANREVLSDHPQYQEKLEETTRFFSSGEDVVQLMRAFPITVVRHPDFECDDTVHNIAKAYCEFPADGDDRDKADEAIIVSSDTDFIQTIQRFPASRLYNPMKKTWVTAPDYEYVRWKALRGDGSDNIPGIPGVGDKTAERLMKDLESLHRFLRDDPEKARVFQRNTNLIEFRDFSDDELEGLQTHVGTADWNEVKRVFTELGFNSIVNDKSWKKFTETFDAAGKLAI